LRNTCAALCARWTASAPKGAAARTFASAQGFYIGASTLICTSLDKFVVNSERLNPEPMPQSGLRRQSVAQRHDGPKNRSRSSCSVPPRPFQAQCPGEHIDHRRQGRRMTPLDAALALIARGWNPVPVAYRSKKPIGSEWQRRVIDHSNVEQFFNGADLNIGAMMGTTSKGLTDVDLDCAEAIAIAPYILAPTQAIFGRASKRFSHYLFYTGLAQIIETAVIEFNDPRAKKQKRTDGRLVELRIGGHGLGAQTVMPPSVHPSAEEIRWEENGEPAKVDGAELLPHVKTIAAYSLLARYWPQAGSGHHDCARVVGGFLARLGHAVPVVRSHVEGIARAAESSRWKELSRTAADAAQAHQDGKRTFGLKALRESFGPEIADKVSEWLDYENKASASAAGVGTATQQPRPQIRIVAGELPRIVTEAEDALLGFGCEFYQRGGLVVRPVLSRLKASGGRETDGWRLIPVTVPHLIETLTRAAEFLRWDARKEEFVPCDAPTKVSETYLAREGAWRLRVLTGVCNAPFLRADGSVCDQPGYDAASGMLFKPNGGQFPPIPSHPSRDDARDALKALYNLLDGFPFLAAADRATAIAGLFTAIDRRAMPAAPLHAFTAPIAGTGKSLLVDIFAALATGKLMPVIAQGRTEEELEKRLGASLLAGDAMVSIDNCGAPLQSSLLCQALTQQVLNIRMLGLSRNVETPVNAAFYATGNNLQIAGDLSRRTLLCSLDAGCERPELRTFDADAIETARHQRGRLVTAALTVLRAWHLAREAGERLGLPPFGSFDIWSRRVREPLVWLDAGDPCDTIIKVRANDPFRAALAAVLAQWRQHLGIGVAYTVQLVITKANTVTDFQAALLAVGASNPGSTVISSVKLGRWLPKVDGRIVNGLVLRDAGMVTGYPLWRLDQA
jgi:hypothetical protein